MSLYMKFCIVKVKALAANGDELVTVVLTEKSSKDTARKKPISTINIRDEFDDTESH